MIDRNLSYFVYTADCLSVDECKEVIDWSEDNELFSSSKVGDSIENSDIRKSKTFHTIDEKYSRLILDRINSSFFEYCEHHLEDLYLSSIQRTTVDGYKFEPIQFTKYDETDYYHWHVDQGQDPKTICRLLSFVLYLNDDFDGGFTEFGFGKYKPKPGQVLIFPSSFLYPHCGTPVLSGTKRIIVTWLTNLGINYGSQ